MKDRETARMRKYGESKTTRITSMMETVPHITSGLGLRKFQADGFLLTQVYNKISISNLKKQCDKYGNRKCQVGLKGLLEIMLVHLEQQFCPVL